MRKTPATMDDVVDLLRDLDNKLETHLAEEKELRPKVIELVDILQKSKGAIAFIKLSVTVAGAVAIALAWAKDHIKW